MLKNMLPNKNIIIIIIIINQLLLLIESTNLGLLVNKNDDLVRQCVGQALADHDSSGSVNFTFFIYDDQLIDLGERFDFILDFSGNWKNLKVQSTRNLKMTIDDSKEIDNSINYHDVLIVRTPNYILTRTHLTIVDHYNLTNLFILYDNRLGLDEKKFIANDLPHKFNNEQFNTDLESNITLTLKKLKMSEFNNVLVIGESLSINKLLNKIQQSDLFRKPYVWYILTKSINKISCTLCKHGQFIKIQPTQSNLHEYDNKLNASAIKSENLIDAYFYYDLTNLLIKGIVHFHQLNGQIEINDTQLKVSFLDSIRTIVDSEISSGRYGDWVITNSFSDGTINNVIFQSLTMQLTLNNKLFNELDSKVIGYMDLTESVGNIYTSSLATNSDESILRIITVLHPPFVMKRTANSSNANNDDYYGFLIDIFEEMKRDFGSNFPKYQIIQATDGQYGIGAIDLESDEITWSGATQDFQSDDADFGLIAMAITDGRELVMDFTEPIFDLVGLSVLIKKPVPQDFTFIFVYVLEKDVWYCVVSSYLLTSIIMSIFDYFNPKDKKKIKKSSEVTRDDHHKQNYGIKGMKLGNNTRRQIQNQFDSNRREIGGIDDELRSTKIEKREKNIYKNVIESNLYYERSFNLKESLWFCLISLTPQGGGEAPSALACRLVATTWWLFGFILVASYTANLAAFLTVSRLDKNLETFEELSRQYKVRYSGIENTFTDEYFTLLAQNEDRYYNIWKDLSLDDYISEYERAQFAVWDYPVSDRYTKIRAQMDELEIPSSFETALRKVRSSNSSKEGYALIGERPSLEWAALLYCDIRVLESTWGYHPIAFPISTKDPFNLKLSFDKTLKRMKISGQLEELRYKYWEGDSRVRSCSDYRNPNGITLRNTVGIFMILGLGIFFSLLSLSIENFLYTRITVSELTDNLNKSNSDTDSKTKLITGSHSIWIKCLRWIVQDRRHLKQ